MEFTSLQDTSGWVFTMELSPLLLKWWIQCMFEPVATDCSMLSTLCKRSQIFLSQIIIGWRKVHASIYKKWVSKWSWRYTDQTFVYIKYFLWETNGEYFTRRNTVLNLILIWFLLSFNPPKTRSRRVLIRTIISSCCFCYLKPFRGRSWVPLDPALDDEYANMISSCLCPAILCTYGVLHRLWVLKPETALSVFFSITLKMLRGNNKQS